MHAAPVSDVPAVPDLSAEDDLLVDTAVLVACGRALARGIDSCLPRWGLRRVHLLGKGGHCTGRCGVWSLVASL